MTDFAAFAAAVRADRTEECASTLSAAFHETAKASTEEIAARAAELSDLISTGRVECAAHAALFAGALVESGNDIGPAGLAVVRRLAATAPDLRGFLRALPETQEHGEDPEEDSEELLEPGEVDEEQAAAVSRELGDGGAAVRAWRALDFLGRAALTSLNVEEVRTGLRADPGVATELKALCTELDEATGHYGATLRLLRLDEVDGLLALDRASGRGFRVRADGITDGDQLHALLAGALIGPAGRGLPGTPPAPEVLASFRDQDPPEDEDGDEVSVLGAWTLHDANGRWISGLDHPAAIPHLDGERVVVLDPLTMHTAWSAGRAFPMVRADLEVTAELPGEQVRAWLERVAPARGH